MLKKSFIKYISPLILNRVRSEEVCQVNIPIVVEKLHIIRFFCLSIGKSVSKYILWSYKIY
jgi:hypothetical protein